MPLGARPPMPVSPTGIVTRPAPVARQIAAPNGTANVEVARKGIMVSTVSVRKRGVPPRRRALQP